MTDTTEAEFFSTYAHLYSEPEVVWLSRIIANGGSFSGPDSTARLVLGAGYRRTPAPDLLARLREEVIAVIAEGMWDGDADRSQPDYDRIAALYDDAVSNLVPSDPTPAEEAPDA